MTALTAQRTQQDLATRANVDALLRRFYGRAMVDEMLEAPFGGVRKKGLESHLPVMGDFWETALFRAGLYRGSAFVPHERVHGRHPLGAEHFLRWLALWNSTVDEMYAGPVAERAKVQAARMARAMHRRLAGTDSDELDAIVRQGISRPASSSM